MEISVISIAAAGTDEILLTLEVRSNEHIQKEKFIISAKAYADMRISKGACGEETYDLIEHEARVWAAFKRAIFILGYGECSKKRLVSKLIAKGFERNSAQEAAERIVDSRYLNEQEGARREAQKCFEKLWGEARIRAQLYAKGYIKEDIEDALFALEDSGADYEANCCELILRKYGKEPSEREELQKAISFLVRYGYSISQIKRAFASIK